MSSDDSSINNINEIIIDIKSEIELLRKDVDVLKDHYIDCHNLKRSIQIAMITISIIALVIIITVIALGY